MMAKSPGPYSISSPSSMTTFIRPETKYPLWAAWQLSVCAIGFTCCDHRQPGSKVARPTPPPSMLTSGSWPLPSSNGRVSSGESKLLRMRLATLTSCCGYSCLRDEGLEHSCCCLLRHVLDPLGRHVQNLPQSI